MLEGGSIAVAGDDSVTSNRQVQEMEARKRDYVRVKPLPDAETVLRLIGNWIEDYNNNLGALPVQG